MNSQKILGQLSAFRRKLFRPKSSIAVRTEFADEAMANAVRQLKALNVKYQKMKPAANGRYEKPTVENPMLPQEMAIDKAIENLSEDMKVPVKLYLSGLPYKKIAKVTKTNVRAVKENIRNAQNELRNHLASDSDNPQFD